MWRPGCHPCLPLVCMGTASVMVVGGKDGDQSATCESCPRLRCGIRHWPTPCRDPGDAEQQLRELSRDTEVSAWAPSKDQAIRLKSDHHGRRPHASPRRSGG